MIQSVICKTTHTHTHTHTNTFLLTLTKALWDLCVLICCSLLKGLWQDVKKPVWKVHFMSEPGKQYERMWQMYEEDNSNIISLIQTEILANTEHALQTGWACNHQWKDRTSHLNLHSLSPGLLNLLADLILAILLVCEGIGHAFDLWTNPKSKIVTSKRFWFATATTTFTLGSACYNMISLDFTTQLNIWDM